MDFNELTQLRDDEKYVGSRDKLNSYPYDFMTFYGYTPQTVDKYARRMEETPFSQRAIWNRDNVEIDTAFRDRTLTHTGVKRELYSRPFKTTPYQGVGRGSILVDDVDVETKMRMGIYTSTFKSVDPISEGSIDRFIPLPAYGNPQTVEHTIEKWIRGGEDTRDKTRKFTKPSDYKELDGFHFDGTPKYIADF